MSCTEDDNVLSHSVATQVAAATRVALRWQVTVNLATLCTNSVLPYLSGCTVTRGKNINPCLIQWRSMLTQVTDWLVTKTRDTNPNQVYKHKRKDSSHKEFSNNHILTNTVFLCAFLNKMWLLMSSTGYWIVTLFT